MLAAIALTIGFRPVNSVVVAALRPTGSLGVIASLDLDNITPETADLIAVHTANDRADRALVIVYSEDQALAADVVGAMTCALHGQAVDVAHAGHVDQTTYRDLLVDDAPARPLTDIETSAVAAHAVMMGRNLNATRADLLPRPAARAARDEASNAYADQTAEADQTAHAVATWRLILAGMLDGPEIYGEMAARLTDIRVRDAVLLSMIPEVTPEVVNATVEGREDGTAVGRAIAALVHPEQGREPGHAAHDAADALAQIIAHVPDSAPAWTLWALVAWWNGSGTAARDALSRAGQGYRLAELLRQVLAQGVPPGWVLKHRAGL
ncbi:DUF4192 family protein [Isoptericola sp. F-RaC21]|uniref:DUF4192 family protein n=1 Tax=Isoptericola sp. F-RaC21 TaxID=3141452 RepID=UPI00315B667C